MNTPDPNVVDDAAITRQIESVDVSDSLEALTENRKYIDGYLDALFEHHVISASTYHRYQNALKDRISKRLESLGEDSNVTVTYP
jgi:hypothetical protein